MRLYYTAYMKNTLCKKTENFNIPQAYKGLMYRNRELSSYTSFKIGGITPLFFEPSSVKDLCLLLNALCEQKTSFFILGGGTNLVIADEGIPVPVISTRSLSSVSLSASGEDLILHCGSGLAISTLTEFCVEHSLTGFESFTGLPGTTGGAVYMNARCYDTSMSDLILNVGFLEYCNGYYKKSLYLTCEKDWSYKKSPFQQTKHIITDVSFCLKKGNKHDIEQKCSFFINDRKQKGHFDYPSAGSVFKNNRLFGKPSGQIIDEAGLKGLEKGGAQIAPWHGNIIINVKHASASDVKGLVQTVQKTVHEKFGFNLEPEIIFTQDLF